MRVGFRESQLLKLVREQTAQPPGAHKGRYRIDGPAFVYSDRESGRVVTILGYPTDKIADTA